MNRLINIKIVCRCNFRIVPVKEDLLDACSTKKLKYVQFNYDKENHQILTTEQLKHDQIS